MAQSLLNAVNEVLSEVGFIAGDAGNLTSLTDSSRQRPIDVAVRSINVGIDELYSATGKPQPNEQAESTITLVAGTRAYSLAADLNQLRWPMIDRDNNQYLTEWPTSPGEDPYMSLLIHDPERDDEGLPHWGAISPVDGTLLLDRAPTSEEAGRVYYYQYDKELALSAATDEVPFKDVVFRAMVPVWTEIWKREMRREFDQAYLATSLGRAGRYLTQKQPRSSYRAR